MSGRPTNPFADEFDAASGRAPAVPHDPFASQPPYPAPYPVPQATVVRGPAGPGAIGPLDFGTDDFGLGAPARGNPGGYGGGGFAPAPAPIGNGADPFGLDEPWPGSPGQGSLGGGGQGFQPSAGMPFGGFQGSPAPLATSLRLGSETGIDQAFDLAAVNPLAGAAAPLLWLAARLNESLPVEDVPTFRARVMEEVGRFEANALSRGVQQRLARMCRYALCATIDDIVLSTDWGRQSDWTRSGLVSTFYQETWGGERFFDLLGQLYQRPEETIDALELMAICLSIGFVGKYRVVEGGGGHLARIRAELYRTIRRVRGPHERTLSPPFATIDAPYRAPTRMTWFWGAALGALALLALVYLYWGFVLSQRLETAAEQVAAIAPAVPVFVGAPDLPNVPDPFVATPFADPTQVQRIEQRLPGPVGDGAVEVVRDGDVVSVRLLGASFPTGGGALADAEAPLVSEIAAALDAETGPITVVGHTDNVPIANSSPTRNNDTLSADRAASAAAMLQRFIADPGRVSSIGRGSADPIAANDTAAGRARNRRVEFQIPAEDSPL